MYVKVDIKRKWKNPFKQDQSAFISASQNCNANTMKGKYSGKGFSHLDSLTGMPLGKKLCLCRYYGTFAMP